jgi:hypothetical protein
VSHLRCVCFCFSFPTFHAQLNFTCA